jgi:methylase of polypeptide subunit release factors
LLIALPEVFFENTKKIVIAANLPYIKNNDHENMSDSTVNFEPDLALYG